MYKYKISRFEKIKEDEKIIGLVIGITCFNTKTGNSAYMDWVVRKENFKDGKIPTTKTDIIAHIKSHLTKNLNEADIREAKERGDEEVPEPITPLKLLQQQTNKPKVVYEKDKTILNKELSI